MPELTDILLYLRGEASTEIRDKVQQWLDTSPDAAQELADLERIHEGLIGLKEYRVFDADKAWDNFQTLIDTEDSVQEATVEKKKSRTGLYALLSILFIALVGFLIWFFAIRNPIIVHQSYAEVINITLPDQSKVILQPESTLSHLKFFKKDQPRIVTIDGQAEIDVTSDPSRPFIAETEASAVKVLGTIFDLETEGNVSTVENKEGLIRFSDIEDESKYINLKKGDKFTYDGTDFINVNLPPPPPPPLPGKNYSVESLMNILVNKYPARFIMAPEASLGLKDIIRVDLNNSLDDIISQLDSSSTIGYRKNGDYYEVYQWFK